VSECKSKQCGIVEGAALLRRTRFAGFSSLARLLLIEGMSYFNFQLKKYSLAAPRVIFRGAR